MNKFFNTVFGITKRTYYFLAVCLTIGYLYNVGYQMYKWDGNPWYKKAEAESFIQLHRDKNQKPWEYYFYLKTLPESELQKIVDSDEEVKRAESTISNFYLTLLGLFMTLPIAIGLHKLARWIIWGKLK